MSWRITKPELTLFATYAICNMHCQGSQGQCEVRSAICGLEGSLVGGVYSNAVPMVLEWSRSRADPMQCPMQMQSRGVSEWGSVEVGR